MLPTSGYFRGIGCPGHGKGHCNRPYCHFHHSSKKETSSAVPHQGSSAAENDKPSDQSKAKSISPVKTQVADDSPSCSSTETSSVINASLDNQSELLQQLVSAAVKKVLIENPHLTSVAVDPSTLIAQTAAEVSPVNSSVKNKNKKKYYPRPPDTPSYNPTPIRELNKRKRSNECQDELPSNSKAAKYFPASLSLKNVISDVNENKDSGESEATDFSSPEDEDLDKRNCDFDILEEVLAEHSQNNKIKVKKKKVKALGKLKYNLSNFDKKVDESSMISDAQTISDQDSNTCDGPKEKPKELEESAETESYFLPPSPIFTSSSDGFGAYNSVVYAKSETNDEEDAGKSKNKEDKMLAESLRESDKSTMKENDLEYNKKPDQIKDKNCMSKSVSKGHALLPKFVHALGTPKMSRPSVRSWNPQSKNTAAVADASKDSSSDPLEAMLQEMDGELISQKDHDNVASEETHPILSSPKNSKKYKVDLDKEIKSLTSSPKVNDNGKEKIIDKGIKVTESGKEKLIDKGNKVTGSGKEKIIDKGIKVTESGKEKIIDKGIKVTGSGKEKMIDKGIKVTGSGKEKMIDKGIKVTGSGNEEKKGTYEVDEKMSVSREKLKKKEKIAVTSNGKGNSGVISSKERKKDFSEGSELMKSEKRIAIDETTCHSEKSHDEGSEEDAIDKEKKSSDESEVERDSRKKKRKRDHSSGSESHDSYHRKKRKKSHKRRKKYKKRRRRRDSKSDSGGESDVGLHKDDDDDDDDDKDDDKDEDEDEKEDKDRLDSSEAEDKEENGKAKKHKKRKKKSKHRKKSKRRRRSKNKLRKRNKSRSQSESLSSSQDRSRSTSRHRSSSRHRSRSSSRHRSRSHDRHRSRSHDRHRSRSDSRHRSSSRHRSGTDSRSRSRSNSRYRSRSKTKHRSRSNSRQRSKSNTKHTSRSKSRSRSHSKDRNQSQKEIRHSSQNHSTRTSREKEARHRKVAKSGTHSTGESVSSSKSDKGSTTSAISTPMPVDPSKIKVEKDALLASASVIVPDLSIVKKEKEEIPPIPCTASVKIERSEGQSEDQQNLNDLDVLKNSSHRKTELLSSANSVEKCGNSHEERKGLNNTDSRRESSSHHRLPKETNSQDSHQKEKEHNKASEAKERRKSNSERRSSSESISNQKSSRRSSAESKKMEKEHTSSKALPSERRISTEKNKDGKVSSSHKESQPRALSIFDMVMASMEPSKPKALKEISIFDKVSAVGYESHSDSPLPSDVDSVDLSQESKDKSSNQSPGNQRKNLSHSISREKSSSDARIDKAKSLSKSDKDEHSTKSTASHSKSKSHREEVASKHSHSSSSVPKLHHLHSSSSTSKHPQSSSSKQKSSSHHDSSAHSHKSSSSTHKSSGLSKGVTEGNDTVGTLSRKSSSHTISSKSKEVRSSSHSSSKQDVSHSSKSSHSRNPSTSSIDKEKEHSSTTHKSRDHSKKSSGREKEHSSSSSNHHGSKGRESSKDGVDVRKDHKIHDKHKESTKSKHDKGKEVSSGKKSANKQNVRMDENVSSSSDRELYGAHDNDDDDDDDNNDVDEGNNSPFPDLSALDEIPQDDWEQLINSSRDDLKHLENLRSEEDFDLEDLDKDDPDIMEECLQMYNAYKPDPAEIESQVSSKKKTKVEPKEEVEPLPSKQRIARTTSGGNMLATKPNADLKTRKKTPAQVMMERYQKLKEEQAELLKQLERQKQQLEEQGRGVAAGAVSSSTSSRSKPGVVSSSNVSSTTPSRSKIAPATSTSQKSSPHSTTGVPKRRMSHVPNVSSLLQAKEKIKHLQPSKSRSLVSPNVASASGSLAQTIAHTVAKGGKRFAHTPKLETLQRPTIAPEFGSKVPPNIRQRYLNSLIDECLKFLSEKEAFNLGLAEERVCFLRASSRMVYLNLAVNAVKRLRNQQEAGEAAQEIMDTDPRFKENSFMEDASSSEKPSTSGISSSPSREVKKQQQQHPVNPNHSRLSHFSVLAVGGNRGSWSIEKPKKNTVNVQNCLKGVNFYNYIKKYILTEKHLEENGFPCPDPDEKGKAIVKMIDTRKKLSPSSVERYCDRCSTLYKVDKWGFPLSIGPCVHHWGRPYKRRGYSGMETRYSCCSGDLESEGCCQATTHVSHNYNPYELRGYVRTLPKDVRDNDYGVYALDCEMSYTTAGSELTRVTVVDTEGNTVYEQLVKPENPIIDYNTRFSGITESDMEDVKTTIRDVQASMLARFSDKTILIGHSLESDFHALKLIHDTVVDTSVVFPHKMGAPYKRALKNLASEYLKKIIQNDVSGHDSAEDAITCMHLMHWRVKEDLKGFGQK